MDNKAVGMRLEEARVLKGLRQYELAQKVGVGNSTISRFERGLEGVSPNIFNRIAIALDCDPTWLLTGKTAIEISSAPSVGARLELARILKGLRQKELAQRLGLSINTISMYERDLRRIAPRIFNRLSTEIDCDPRWLLTGANTSKSSIVTSEEVHKHYTNQTLLSAPKWVQNYTNKYLLPIRASTNKRNLKKFFKHWMKTHPVPTISYSRFMAMRKEYHQYGVAGLYPHYGYMKGSI